VTFQQASIFITYRRLISPWSMRSRPCPIGLVGQAVTHEEALAILPPDLAARLWQMAQEPTVTEEQIETLLRLFKQTSLAGSDRVGPGR
jgi:hypothetical protein